METMTIDLAIHIARNPYGYDRHLQRIAVLALADAYEAQEKKLTATIKRLRKQKRRKIP